MSTVNAFSPKGQTVLVTTSAVQVKTQDNVYSVSYRVRNLSTNTAYFAWAPADPLGASVTPPTPAAPSAGSPVTQTMGMFPESVEVFSLPPNAWFLSDTANAFEVTPGEGI